MISRRALINEGESLLDLGALVEAYEEIAANQMQKVRKSVLQSRNFMDGVTEIFAKVRISYDKEIKRLEGKLRGKRAEEFSVLPRNGRTAAVFVSANSGLFGDIVERTFTTFLDFVKKDPNNVDAVIVGKLGLRMLTDRSINLLYNYFDFPDDKIDFDAVNVIMRYLLQYERITVFHGQFRNLVTQEPVMTGVSGHDLVEKSNKSNQSNTTNRTNYLFEPSLKEVLRVFEGEILSSIFAQAMHESQLAKFASRLYNLDRAMENIDNRKKNLTLIKRRLDHQLAGRKQLGRIAGMSLWS